jgi:hypothetical protein
MIDSLPALARGGKRIESRIETDHLRAVLDARRLAEAYAPPPALRWWWAPSRRVLRRVG